MQDFNIYRNMDKIDADALMMSVFKTTDLSKIKLPKDQKINLTAKGNPVFIKTLVSIRLKNFIKEHIDEEWSSYYDLADALNHMMTAQEVRDELFKKDPGMHSDAYQFVSPEFNFKNMEKLTIEQEIQRIKVFAAITALLLNEKTITAIAEYAPKKKNGGFHRGKVIRIANMGFAYNSSSMLAIYGKALGDTKIEIQFGERYATPEEADYLSEDFINTFSDELGLTSFINGLSPDPSKTFDSYLELSDYQPAE